MKTLLEQTLVQAKTAIQKADSQELSSEGFLQKLVTGFKPKPLGFIGDKNIGNIKNVSYDEYISTIGGGAYNPANTAQKVTMTMFVDGDDRIFDLLKSRSQLPNIPTFFATKSSGRKAIFYIGYADQIDGNAEKIRELKIDSDSKYENVTRTFEKVNVEIEDFFRLVFRPFVEKEVDAERERRKQREDAIKGLK